MAPTPGSPPSSSPSPPSSSTARPDPAQSYSHTLRSLHRRSMGRLAGDGISPAAKNNAVSQDLEADLRLAAELGQGLLSEKLALQQRLEAAEKGQQKLLDRLTSSVKENSQLQRRLEETHGSLENVDASNRALLVQLEEDRKTISRLSVDSGKLVSASSSLKNLQRSHEDTLQELAAERRRADAAELKSRKLGERTQELEVRLKKALEDMEELRQDKVLRSRRSHDALSQLRARYSRGETMAAKKEPVAGVEGVSDNAEAKELLKLVENLVSENHILRSESMELAGLLEMSREEQVDLRTAMAAQEIFPEEQEDHLGESYGDQLNGGQHRRQSLTSNLSTSAHLPSESILSPSVSAALTDYDFTRHPSSPGSTHATSFTRSWAPNTSLSHSQRAIDLSRTLSGSSFGSEEPSVVQLAGVSYDPRLQRKTSRKGRPSPVTSASAGVLNGGVVPLGRGHTRRAMSMDVSPYIRANPLSVHDLTSAPTSPQLDYFPSASSRPPSIFSTTSEDPEPSSRPRRHHRPLSLSLGPSLFPLVPEDKDKEEDRPISPFTRQPSHRRRTSVQSGNGILASPLVGGLGVSSPSLAGLRRSSHSPSRPAAVTVDSSTQTTPPATPVQIPRLSHPAASTPDRISLSSFSRSPSPQPNLARSSTSVSEVSDGRSIDLSVSTGGSHLDPSQLQAHVEQRTAALGQLIEHASKLLSRVQAADIATQEKRLKKQNLPGDVRHLAQATLRDLANDIDGVRHHFRRVVELERASQVKDSPRSPSPSNSNDSLVTRRDFVSLVKLLRDLLYETARLRSIVNRVQLDPSLATTLDELDVPTALEPEQPAGGAAGAKGAAATSGGLLAPLSRLFGASLSPDEPSLSRQSSSAQLRPPPPKRGGSSTVSTATVNVEFGKEGVRQSSSSNSAGPAGAPAARLLARPGPAPAQVKRDISSIFAGASSRTVSGSSDPWVVLPPSSSSAATPIAPGGPATRLASAASSYMPFGRLLSSYRPALSSTTNAVLDSLPHSRHSSSRNEHSSSALADGDEDSSEETDDLPPSLLERQLRPRGLSDSSIRSTFASHSHGAARANPHHRLISPASLALSSEPLRVETSALSSSPAANSRSPSLSSAISGGPAAAVGGGGGLAALDALKQLNEGGLGEGSVSRRSSAANLRAKPSSSRLRESALPSSTPTNDIPPVPSMPATVLASSTASTSNSTTDSTLHLSSSPTAYSPTPIRIAPPSPRPHKTSTATQDQGESEVTTTGGAAGLFGTLVSSGWGSLIAGEEAGGGGGEQRKKQKLGQEGGRTGESWKDGGRFGGM